VNLLRNGLKTRFSIGSTYSEKFGLCVAPFFFYLLDTKSACHCPPSSASSWAKRTREHLEVTDKRLDVFFEHAEIVPSDVIAEARSLQRDIEKAIEVLPSDGRHGDGKGIIAALI